MTLTEAVEKVVEEFDFSDGQIQEAVKEFVSEMGKLQVFGNWQELTRCRGWVEEEWNDAESDSNVCDCGSGW